MFSFLKKNAPAPATPEFSSTSPSTAHIPAVITAPITTSVTAPSTALSPALVTADLAASIATTIASSRIITKWTDPKPFPEPDLSVGKVQIWPTHDMPARYPTAERIAGELFDAMQRNPLCAGKWVLAMCIETVIYPKVCDELRWPPRPWKGKDGVAVYFAKLSPYPSKCFRV